MRLFLRATEVVVGCNTLLGNGRYNAIIAALAFSGWLLTGRLKSYARYIIKRHLRGVIWYLRGRRYACQVRKFCIVEGAGVIEHFLGVYKLTTVGKRSLAPRMSVLISMHVALCEITNEG